MSHERTNTQNKYKKFPPIPEGRRRFIVCAPVKKMYGKSGAEFYIWSVQYQNDHKESCLGEQALMPSMMGPLLRVLGCREEEPNVFDWDTDDMEGRAFMATVAYAPDKKDSTIIRVHFSEYGKGDQDEDNIEAVTEELQD